MGNQESSRSLYAIPGLDYVAHEDIIPYVSAEKTPLNHELFDKFLMPNPKGGMFQTDSKSNFKYLVYFNLLLFF